MTLLARAPIQVDQAVVARAAQQVRIDGYAIVEEVVPLEKVRLWRAAIGPMLAERAARSEANRGPGRHFMRLPFVAPFSDPDFAMHPVALAIMRAIMGAEVVCGLFTSDTPLPGAPEQQVHRDIDQLYKSIPLVLPPAALVLNIPLVDYSPDNGPMEIWPGGTHLATDDADLAALAPRMHSERPLLRTGSLMIRDLRTWHRGTANRSSAARPNLTATYTPPWHRLLEVPVTVTAASFAAMDPAMRSLFRFARVVADGDAAADLDRPLNG